MSIKEYIFFNKKKIIIFIGIVLVVLCGIYLYFNPKEEIKEEDRGIVFSKEEDPEKEQVFMCYFDIKGEVKNPGVYFIECDKRVNDAIIKSGGLTKNSDTSVLNLSKKIEDGMVIKVYSKKEVSSYLESLKEEEKKLSICNSSNIKNDACINTSGSSNINSSLININTASLNELMTLTGIGESKAKNIISYRNNTPFKSIEEILNVDGIGESIYVNIKENITV